MLASTLDHYLSTQVEHHLICGMSVLVAQDGQPWHQNTYGYAQKFTLNLNDDLKKLPYLEKIRLGKQCLASPIPLTPQHLFDLASVTKVLATTFALMLLIDQKQLGLDDTLQQHLPVFAQSNKKNITLRQLLCHTSGLPAWRPLYFHANHLTEAIDTIISLPLEQQTDQKRCYSDLGFMVLHYLIEQLTQQKLDVFLSEHVYKKLRCENTLYLPDASLKHIAATSHGNPYEYKMIADKDFGYACEEKADDFPHWREYTLIGEANDGNAYHTFAGVSGHAGLFATATEVNRLMQLMLNHGTYHGTQLIQANTVKAFVSKNKQGHGLGWAMSNHHAIGDLPLTQSMLADPFFEGAYGHAGFTGNFILGIPSKNISVIILSNRQNLGVNAEGRYHTMHDVVNAVVGAVYQAFSTTSHNKP